MLTGRTKTVCQPVCLLLPATSTRWFMEENRADLISACLWAPRRSCRVQQPLGTQSANVTQARPVPSPSVTVVPERFLVPCEVRAPASSRALGFQVGSANSL